MLWLYNLNTTNTSRLADDLVNEESSCILAEVGLFIRIQTGIQINIKKEPLYLQEKFDVVVV